MIDVDLVRERCLVPRMHAESAATPISDMEDRGDAEYAGALRRLEAIAVDVRGGAYLGVPRSIVIAGPFGTGKTRAACRLVAQAYAGARELGRNLFHPRCPLFVKARDAVAMRFTKRAHDDETRAAEDMRERVFGCDFLALDDIGRFAGYKGEEDFLESIVEHRYEEMLSTVVTTSTLDFESPRLADFLGSSQYERVVFDGRSARG